MGLRKLGGVTPLGLTPPGATPVYLLADRPSAASRPVGEIIRISDVGYGGSYWRTDGTYWRPVGGSVLLYFMDAEAVSALITGNQALGQYTLPAGILQLGGGNVRIRTWYAKIGTLDSLVFTIKMNTATVHTRTVATGVSSASATYHEVYRVSATSARRGGVGALADLSSLAAGVTTTGAYAAITTNDLDSASNVIDVVVALTDGAADGITDSVTLRGFTVEYVA